MGSLARRYFLCSIRKRCQGHIAVIAERSSVNTLLEVLNEAYELVDDIQKHAKGLDGNLLLEVLALTDADFSEPMDGETLIAALRSERSM
jgi:methylglyoxal synthase